MISVNYFAVLVVAIINMILGGIWYGPLFGKQWTKLMGLSRERLDEMKAKGMTMPYVIMFIASLIMSFILARFVVFTEAGYHIWNWMVGFRLGFEVWLGFVAPVTIAMVLWEGKPWRLWMIVTGYSLVGLCLMGSILAAWR